MRLLSSFVVLAFSIAFQRASAFLVPPDQSVYASGGRWAAFSLLLFFFLQATPAGLSAQELRTNEQGEKIIVYADGSARYFNDLSLIDAQQRDSAGAAYPVVAVTIEPLEGGVDPTEDDLRRIAERKLELAREAASLAGDRAIAAVNSRVNLETALAAARQTASIEEASMIQRRLLLARKVEEQVLSERTTAEQRLAATRAVVEQRRYVEAYNQARRAARAGPTAPLPATRAERTLGLLLPAEPLFSSYGSAPGRRPLAEPPPCGAAPMTGAPTDFIALSEPQLFFTHTDENLRPFLAGKEYLTCSLWGSRNRRGDRFLHLRLTFANPNAGTSYGYLDENSSLSLHLLNGRHLSLQSIRKTVGILDHTRREINYNVIYALPRGAAQELENQPLDFVRIFWSSGFEEYAIYQVDALRRVLACF